MTSSTSNKTGAAPAAIDLTKLHLTAKLIPIIAPFIAKNDIRHYLNAVNVRPHKDGGAIICATNGHALGAIYDRKAVCEAEVTLRMDARFIQACAGGISKDRVVEAINGRLVVAEVVGGAEVYIQPGNPVVQCEYPRYERVIPALENVRAGQLGSLSFHLIRLAEMAATAAVKAKGENVAFNNAMQFFNVDGDPDKSTIVRIVANDDFIGVIMPMRGDPICQFLPGWVAHLAKVDDLASMGAKS